MYEYGLGVEENSVEAEKWYQKAADQGDADARNRLESLRKTGNATWWNKLFKTSVAVTWVLLIRRAIWGRFF